MPPSGRRKARTEPILEPTESIREPSDAEAEMMNTPSRKRRRVHGTAAPKATRSARKDHTASHESEGTEAQEHVSDDEGHWNKQLNYAAKYIRRLRTASYDVAAVTILNNNAMNLERQDAYARVSGREWTFFVRETSFTIGRPIKPANPRTGTGIDTSPAAPRSERNGASFPIDIDLGPDQQVSRVHAQVDFDSAERRWALTVNGRNGLLVDEARLEKGDHVWLHSGAVISILGTQMMFTLPQQSFELHDTIRAMLHEEGDTDEEVPDEKPASQKGPASLTRPDSRQNASQTQASQPRSSGQTGLNSRQLAQAPSLPGTPLTARSKAQPKSKPSPAYGRGMLLETTEDIDYSAESSKDIKPPHSYAQLIGQAILASEEQKLTLANIYEFIKEHYAFYRSAGPGWQNSIRHNLSLSKSFEKVARRTDEPGKGMKWQIVAENREDFVKKNITNPRRGLARVGSSGPNSPLVAPSHATQTRATERLQGALNYETRGGQLTRAAATLHGSVQTGPRSTTPPLSSSVADHSFTPDRSARTDGHAHVSNGTSTQTPVYPRTRGQLPGGRNAGAGANTSGGSSRASALGDANSGSPSVLGGASNPAHALGLTEGKQVGGSLYVDYPNAGMALQTPLTRHKLHLAPPSTAHVPSQHMIFSSPAPFWKYSTTFSTPPKPPFESPRKKGDESADEAAENDDEAAEGADDEAAEDADDTVMLNGDADEDADVKLTDESDQTLQPSSPPFTMAGTKRNLSSLKGYGTASGGDEDEDEDDNDVSPNKDVSPSRTISRPVSRQLPAGPGSSPFMMSPHAAMALTPIHPPMPKLNLHAGPVVRVATVNGGPVVRVAAVNGGPVVRTMAVSGSLPRDEEEEGGGIDLAKGFQRIGAYHRALNQAANMGLPQSGGIVTPRG